MHFQQHLEAEQATAPWDVHFHRAVDLAVGTLALLAVSAIEPSAGVSFGAALSGTLAVASLGTALRTFRVANGRWPRVGRLEA